MPVCASARACADIHVQAQGNSSRGSSDGRQYLLLTCTMLAHSLFRRSDDDALIRLGPMQMARFLLHMWLTADSRATLRSTGRRAHSRALLDGFLLSSALISAMRSDRLECCIVARKLRGRTYSGELRSTSYVAYGSVCLCDYDCVSDYDGSGKGGQQAQLS